jgi:hypothetical protein
VAAQALDRARTAVADDGFLLAALRIDWLVAVRDAAEARLHLGRLVRDVRPVSRCRFGRRAGARH